MSYFLPIFPRFFLGAVILILSLSTTEVILADDVIDVTSPEHQALLLAKESLSEPNFTLREDYWKGEVAPRTGRAVRLQFFKRNEYRLFFGVAPTALPKGSRLHLHIINQENAEVSTVAGEPDAPAVKLVFENNVGSGLYLVLMRIEMPPGPFPDTEIPAVLFYGWR